MNENTQQIEVTSSVIARLWWAVTWRASLIYIFCSGSVMFFALVIGKIAGLEKKEVGAIVGVSLLALSLGLSVWSIHFILTKKFKKFHVAIISDTN